MYVCVCVFAVNEIVVREMNGMGVLAVVEAAVCVRACVCVCPVCCCGGIIVG